MAAEKDPELSIFELISQTPFTCVSAFSNDLATPLCLNQLLPAPEAIFVEPAEQAVDFAMNASLLYGLNVGKLDLNFIILRNSPPEKATAHEHCDEFMRSVLENSYQNIECVKIGPNPSFDAQNPSMTVNPPVQESSIITKAPSKLKLSPPIANNSLDAESLLRHLVAQDSFVPAICFDCADDIYHISRLTRLLIANSSISADAAELLLNEAKKVPAYLADYEEHIDLDSKEKDDLKTLYCMSLLALYHTCLTLTSSVLKGHVPFDRTLSWLTSLCSEFPYDSPRADLVAAVSVESYIMLIGRFSLDGSELSRTLSIYLDLYFGNSLGLVSRGSVYLAIVQIFSKYPDLQSLVIDCILASATENSKLAWTLLLGCLQAFAGAAKLPSVQLVCSSHLNTVLEFICKNDSPDWIVKFGPALTTLVDELICLVHNPDWILASFVLNFIGVQLFFITLREDSLKPNSPLKLKAMDCIASISMMLAAPMTPSGKSYFDTALVEARSSIWYSRLFNHQETISNLCGFYTSSIDFANLHVYLDNFIREGPLSKIPERAVSLFVKLIGSESIQVRSKAIRHLHTLMATSAVNNSNSAALRKGILLQAQDRSISVRDAVLEFLGKLLSSPMEAEADTVELVDGVLARLKDAGVSVRKRAVKIVGDLLQKSIVRDNARVACVSHLLALIPNEEDDIVCGLIEKTLVEQWLNGFAGAEYRCADGLRRREITRSFVLELMAIMEYLGSDTNSLQKLFAKVGPAKDSQGGYDEFFSAVTDDLLENLLQSFESAGNISVRSTLEAIAIFSSAKSKALEQHLSIFQALLRSEDATISLLALRLLSEALPQSSLASMKKLQGFENDLQSLIFRGSEAAVRMAIETLYFFINNCSHQYAIMSSLWQKFCEYLKDSSGNDEEGIRSALPHVCRAIVALGVLCAQSSLHMEREFGAKDHHQSPQVLGFMDFISFYWESPFSAIRVCCTQAIGSLILVCPQICELERVKIVLQQSLLDSEIPCRLKALSIFDQLCTKFDEGSLSGAENTADIRNLLSMQGKESFFCACIQANISKICDIASGDTSIEVRSVALRICAATAVLGLVNPQLSIPSIVVGTCSSNLALREFCQSSLDRILTRFPSMIMRDFVEIGRLIFRLQQQSNDLKSFVSGENGGYSQSLLSYYFDYLKSKKGGRIIDSISGIFAFLDKLMHAAGTESTQSSELLLFVPFLLTLIATLPFSSLDEVMLILSRIQQLYSAAMSSLEPKSAEQGFGLIYTILCSCERVSSYLVKSYPSVLGHRLDGIGENYGKDRGIVRVPFIFEISHGPSLTEEKHLTREFMATYVNNISSIPILLSEAPKQAQSSRRRQTAEDLIVEDHDEDFNVEVFLMEDAKDTDEDTDEEEVLVVSRRAMESKQAASQSVPNATSIPAKISKLKKSSPPKKRPNHK